LPAARRTKYLAMEFHERLQWLARLALMVFVLASAAFLSAITVIRIAIQGREVIVPDVSGKSLADAEATLHGRSLGIKIEDRVYSVLPSDAVVRQSPPSGVRVKVGQYVHVALSLGPQQVKIPDLSEKSLRADRIQLLRSGLQVGEVSSVSVPGEPMDTVLMQFPAFGAPDASSSHVDLLVSLGATPPTYVMPDLQGMSLADAEAKLSSSGLRLGKLSFATGDESSHGIVAGQNPAPGSKVDAASPIELQVAE
jgi:eukaryotic-like serine/threonine-protein kinase